MSSASLILADRGLALSEPKAVGAQGSAKVLAASSLGGCLVFVSSAVVTVALAAIGRDMRLSPLDLQWVMNAELLPLAALTLVAGALGDRFGQKRIFLGGIALYGLGAAAIGFAPSFAPLIVGRFLQGLGEAVILPNGLSVLGRDFPADKKARAVGIWSAAAAVASGVAPVIAGAILDHGSWRTAFLMLLPIVAGALAVGAAWISKDAPTGDARIDVGGAVLSTVGLGGLGAGLTSLTNGSGPNLWVLVTLIVGLGSFAGLIVSQRRLGENAMLPPSLFAARSVVGANLFSALLYGPFTVMLTLIPFVMIRGAHLSTLAAGLAFIPLQVLITVVSPLAGMLCRRFGRRLPLFAGGTVVALGCTMALRVGPNATYWADIFPGILLLALGMSLAIAPLTTLVLTSVEPDRAGTASGVNSAVSRAGSLFAIALLGGVLQQGGPQLFSGFHMAMAVAAVASVFATLAVFVIEPGPHVDFIPRD
ncbi:MFS transporter [Bradyrhizobium pachyrhizi]|uniref:MFS transporter n=1 Tax=Bradyrhizobium pachyrhizi TaxID=280333 RepID=A0A844SPK4_9BRAD|nr:MFS transporter [Bradyrhizobium pachyrhizi]MVT67736.1 MFS transporter [Bradyrhizobium pachyrhizi]WFU55244.1 MFS transporter [Bradyrhizobium pachyrhizi]